MEITQAEYMDLQNKIAELQAQVGDMAKKPRNTFAGRIAEEPMVCLTAESDYRGERVSVRSNCNSDAWLLFVKLAKLIHREDYRFVADRTGPNIGYLRSHGSRKAPTRIEQLSEEQFELSVNMLDEMIAVYNRYFKEIHKGVYLNNLCDKPGEFRFVRVAE